MNNTDLISVIIPTYNRANLIKRSAESVLNQTYKNLELIIVDDGSTDNTKEVIDSLNDNRIVYIKQENQGACAARNKGIDAAKGKYIAFHDSDDAWHLDKLEKQLNALKQHNADVVFCKMFVFGNLRKRIVPQNLKEGFLNKHTLTLGIGTPTILGKRNVFINNKFDIDIPRLQDFEITLRIKQRHSVYCLAEPLIDCCVQQDSITTKPEKILKFMEILLKKDYQILKEYPHSSLDFLSKSLLEESFKIKDKKIRQSAINLVFKINDSWKTKLKYFFNRIYVYRIRTLMYKTASKAIKKVITILR